MAISIILFILVVPELLFILAPESYQEGVNCIPPIACSVFFVYLFGVYGNIEFYFNKNRFTMYVSSVSAVLNIVLNYIFIRKYGYIAAAFTTLICYIILTFMHAVFAEYVYKKEKKEMLLDETFIWGISIIVSAVSILLTLIYDNFVIRYGILVTSLIIIFVKKEKMKKMIKVMVKNK